jgi:hypothetical protein
MIWPPLVGSLRRANFGLTDDMVGVGELSTPDL